MTIKDGNDYRMKGKLYWWKTDWKRKGTGKLKPKLTQERKKRTFTGYYWRQRKCGVQDFLKNLYRLGGQKGFMRSLLAQALGPVGTSQILPLLPNTCASAEQYLHVPRTQ